MSCKNKKIRLKTVSMCDFYLGDNGIMRRAVTIVFYVTNINSAQITLLIVYSNLLSMITIGTTIKSFNLNVESEVQTLNSSLNPSLV